jgi:hypothetical protein
MAADTYLWCYGPFCSSAIRIAWQSPTCKRSARVHCEPDRRPISRKHRSDRKMEHVSSPPMLEHLRWMGLGRCTICGGGVHDLKHRRLASRDGREIPRWRSRSVRRKHEIAKGGLGAIRSEDWYSVSIFRCTDLLFLSAYLLSKASSKIPHLLTTSYACHFVLINTASTSRAQTEFIDWWQIQEKDEQTSGSHRCSAARARPPNRL